MLWATRLRGGAWIQQFVDVGNAAELPRLEDAAHGAAAAADADGGLDAPGVGAAEGDAAPGPAEDGDGVGDTSATDAACVANKQREQAQWRRSAVLWLLRGKPYAPVMVIAVVACVLEGAIDVYLEQSVLFSLPECTRC